MHSKEQWTHQYFCLQADIFSNPSAEKNNIISAGEKAIVCLYGGKPEEGLDSIRYNRYCEKVMSNTTCVSPTSLPPTSAAAKYHSLRVYYQVQETRGAAAHLQPVAWGWKVMGGNLIPIQTDKEPAPKPLLEVVRCSCKTGCNTMQCECRKHGLDCLVACGDCRGACVNSPQIDSGADDDDEDLGQL